MKIIKDDSPEECLQLLRALSDETRQEIIIVLVHNKEMRANDIASHFSLSRPTVSHHLNLMKRSGILDSRKDGKEIYYSLNKKHVIDSLKLMIKKLKGSR